MTAVRNPAPSATVDAVMTRSLLTVDVDESILMALELTRRADVHHLPVLSRDGQYAGIVTADTLRARAGESIASTTGRPTLRDVMNTRDFHVASSSSVRDAALVMDAHDLDAVAVIDDHQLVGLLTWRDIVRWVAGTARPDHAPQSTHPVLFSLDPVLTLADRT